MTKPTLKLVRCHRGTDAAEIRAKLHAIACDAPRRVHTVRAGALKGCVQVTGLTGPPWSVFKLAPKRGPVLEFKLCIRVRA